MSLILLRDECDPGVRCLSAPWGGALDRQCFKCRFPFSYIFPIVHYTNHSLQVNGYNLGRKREKIVAALTRNETIGRRRQNDVSSCQTRCRGASPLSSSSRLSCCWGQSGNRGSRRARLLQPADLAVPSRGRAAALLRRRGWSAEAWAFGCRP